MKYDDNVDEYIDNASDYDSGNCVNNLIKDMELSTKKFITSGDRPNPYYCSNFANNLLRISKEFPLWTMLMASNGVSIATSSRSEEYFNELKNLVFKGSKNVRADKFLVSHMRSLAGTIKILNADTSNENDEITNDMIISNEQEAIKNESYLSPDKIQETGDDDDADNMDTSIICNSPNEKPIIPTQTPFLNEIETWKGKKNKDTTW